MVVFGSQVTRPTDGGRDDVERRHDFDVLPVRYLKKPTCGT